MATSTKHYTLGLSKIEVGAIAEDGGMGTDLAQLGYTSEETCNLTTDDPEITEFYAEEVDDPVMSMAKAGKMTLAFSIMDPSMDVLAKLMGGTASTGAEGDVWEAPNSAPTVELSIRITSRQGMCFDIPRASFVAKFNGEMRKSSLMLLEVTATILVPKKANTSKLKAYVASGN